MFLSLSSADHQLCGAAQKTLKMPSDSLDAAGNELLHVSELAARASFSLRQYRYKYPKDHFLYVFPSTKKQDAS